MVDPKQWKRLMDFAETFVPGWCDMGMFFADAILLALDRQEQAIYEMERQGEELGWARA